MRGVPLVLTAAITAALLLGAAASASAGSLDQQQTIPGSTADGLSSSQSLAQTFTAGISGGLDQADLYLQTDGSPASQDLIVQIRDGYVGGAGNTVLASRNLIPAQIGSGSFVPVGFNPPAPVVAGQQYAIVAYTSAVFGNGYAWRIAASDPYPAGAPFRNVFSPPSGGWSAVSGADFAFKTYVQPPQPGQTGKRAAALKKCKKKHSKRARRKCRSKANLLPV